MSHVLVAAFFLLVGVGLGCRISFVRARSVWVLRGQQQAELTHGRWHPVVSDGWNGADVPHPRDRAKDQQFMTRQATRSRPIAGQL